MALPLARTGFAVRGVLQIEEAESLETQQEGGGTGRTQIDGDLIAGLYARVNELQRCQTSLKHEITSARGETKEDFCG